MTEAASPGEVAYLAYWPALGSAPPVPWDGLSPVVHRAWEAAALAVAEDALTNLLEVQRILAAAKEETHG